MIEQIDEKPKSAKSGTCLVCAACEKDPEVNKVVHEEKYAEANSLRKVQKRLAEFGVKVSPTTLDKHYLKHQDPAKVEQYKVQKAAAQKIKGKREKGQEVKGNDLGEMAGLSDGRNFITGLRYHLWREEAELKVYIKEHPTESAEIARRLDHYKGLYRDIVGYEEGDKLRSEHYTRHVRAALDYITKEFSSAVRANCSLTPEITQILDDRFAKAVVEAIANMNKNLKEEACPRKK